MYKDNRIGVDSLGWGNNKACVEDKKQGHYKKKNKIYDSVIIISLREKEKKRNITGFMQSARIFHF